MYQYYFVYIFFSPDVRVRGQVRCCHHFASVCISMLFYVNFLLLQSRQANESQTLVQNISLDVLYKVMQFDLIVNPRQPPPQKQESPRCQKRILPVFCMWSIFHQIAQINYCLQFHQICCISYSFLIMSGTAGTNFQNFYLNYLKNSFPYFSSK